MRLFYYQEQVCGSLEEIEMKWTTKQQKKDTQVNPLVFATPSRIRNSPSSFTLPYLGDPHFLEPDTTIALLITVKSNEHNEAVDM